MTSTDLSTSAGEGGVAGARKGLIEYESTDDSSDDEQSAPSALEDDEQLGKVNYIVYLTNINSK